MDAVNRKAGFFDANNTTDVRPGDRKRIPVPVNNVELVTVAMNRSDRLRLYSQITSGMLAKGMPLDYARLGLGFEIPADWPIDQASDVTLAKLIAVAASLGMKIEITDLNLIPL